VSTASRPDLPAVLVKCSAAQPHTACTASSCMTCCFAVQQLVVLVCADVRCMCWSVEVWIWSHGCCGISLSCASATRRALLSSFVLGLCRLVLLQSSLKCIQHRTLRSAAAKCKQVHRLTHLIEVVSA
jgi:hypothetical protein